MGYIVNRKVQKIFFIIAFILISALFAAAFIRTSVYNQTERSLSLSGEGAGESSDISLSLTARTSTWTKIFDQANIETDTPDHRKLQI